MEDYAKKNAFQCIIAESPEDAARKAVELIRRGEADIVMKGFLNTDVLLRAILDKEVGILPKRYCINTYNRSKVTRVSEITFLY